MTEDSKNTATANNNKQSQSEKPAREKKSPKPFIILFLLIAIVGGFAFYQLQKNKPEGKPGWLRINGRIEGYETNVGAKIAGRVELISNREGEEVKKGQELVKLSDEDIQAQLRGAQARFDSSENAVQEAEELVNVSQLQVQQAKLNVTQAQEDAKGRVEQAEANVSSQKANASQAIAQEVQAKSELKLATVRIKRYDELVEKGAVTQDEDDQAHSVYDSAVATVDARHAAVIAAERQVASAQAALLLAKSNLLNPPIRQSQKAANIRSVAQNQAALNKAKNDVKNATASIDEIKANIQYLNIPSPIHGIVTARTVEPGAVVAAGQTVISLLDLNTVYLRAYVPDSDIGKIRVNQEALIYYDSNPKHGVKGKIVEIDPQASFTPENIYFRDDRVKQVFGIKIAIENPDNYAKPGMPADADIDLSPSSGAIKN